MSQPKQAPPLSVGACHRKKPLPCGNGFFLGDFADLGLPVFRDPGMPVLKFHVQAPRADSRDSRHTEAGLLSCRHAQTVRPSQL
jgi:hypothetical protein